MPPCKFALMTMLGASLAIGSLSFANPVRSDDKSDSHESKPVILRWHTDYSKARTEAAKQKRMIVLLFPRRWFPKNSTGERGFEDHPDLLAFLNQHAVLLRPDAADEWWLASVIELQITPTIVIVHWNGKILKTLVGYQDSEKMLNLIKKLSQANDLTK